MCNEARKILTLPNLKVSCTCVRVPVYRAHSISINAEFIKQVNLPDAIQAVSSFTGLDFVEKPEEKIYPMPIYSSEKKIAKLAGSGSIMLQITALLSGSQEINSGKGVALNAIQIAEEMINRNSLRKIF